MLALTFLAGLLVVELGFFGNTAWAIGLGAILLLSFIYFFQDNLLYYPSMPPGSRTQFLNPKHFRLPSTSEEGFEEVFLTTSDGIRIQTWFFRQPTDADNCWTFIYFHGNAGNLSHRLEHIRRQFHSIRCNILLVSYRGYGKSEGKPTEEGLKLDAEAAHKFLYEHPHINPNRIVLFGRSLGGAVAFQLAAKLQSQVAAVIAENTFTSISDMVDVVFPALRHVKFLSKNQWKSIEAVKEISCPLLLLSGEHDELVPPRQMDELFDACKSSTKKIFRFPGGHHNDTWTRPNYDDKVKAFLEELV